jgi:hypothetical protein
MTVNFYCLWCIVKMYQYLNTYFMQIDQERNLILEIVRVHFLKM